MPLSQSFLDFWKSQQLLKVTLPTVELEGCPDADKLAGEYVLDQGRVLDFAVIWKLRFSPVCGYSIFDAVFRWGRDGSWSLRVTLTGARVRSVTWRLVGDASQYPPLQLPLVDPDLVQQGWPAEISLEVLPLPIAGGQKFGKSLSAPLSPMSLTVTVPGCCGGYQWEMLKVDAPGLWQGECCEELNRSVTLIPMEGEPCWWTGYLSISDDPCFVDNIVFVRLFFVEPCKIDISVEMDGGGYPEGLDHFSFDDSIPINLFDFNGTTEVPFGTITSDDGCDIDTDAVALVTPLVPVASPEPDCGEYNVWGTCPPGKVPRAPTQPDPLTGLSVSCCDCSPSPAPDGNSGPSSGGGSGCGGATCRSGVDPTTRLAYCSFGPPPAEPAGASTQITVKGTGGGFSTGFGNNANTLWSTKVVSGSDWANVFHCDCGVFRYICLDTSEFALQKAGESLSLLTTITGVYLSLGNNNNTLYQTDTGWLEVHANGDQYTFNSGGKLTSVSRTTGCVTHDWTFGTSNIVSPNGQRTTLAFDGSGKIKRITDPYNRITTYTVTGGNLVQQVSPELCTTNLRYDGGNRLAAVIDCAGLRTTFAYDGSGLVNKVTHPSGAVDTYVFHSTGKNRVVQPGNAITTFLYNYASEITGVITPTNQRSTYVYSLGKLVASITPAGVRTTFAYETLDDGTRRVKTVVTPSGRTTNVYDVANSRLKASVNALGGRTTMVYGGCGEKVADIDPFNQRTTYLYHGSHGLLKATINPLNQRTTNVYNSLLQVAAQINPLGNRTTTLYSNGQPAVTIDPLGRRSTTIYDLTNRVLAEVQPNAARTSYLYDSDSRRLATINPAGYRTSTIYQFTNVLATIDPFSQRTTYAYDLKGNRKRTTDALGRITTMLYDASSREIAQLTPLLARTTTVYNIAGQAAATINPLGFRTTQLYDTSSRPKASINPLGFRATVIYNAANQKLAEINPLGFRISTVYDIAGRPKAQINPLSRRVTTIYDAANRKLAEINPLLQRTTSVYDNAGRSVGTITPLGFRSTTVYNTASNMTAQIQPLLQRTSMVYNVKGQLAYTMDPLTHRTTSLYDSAGRNVASIMPLGFRSTVVYDKSRTVALIDANSNRTTTVYDALGRNEATVDASSDRTTRVFDAGGRTIAQINELSKGWSMTYDIANQQTQQIDPLNRRQTFTYDNAGRRQTRKDARGNVITYVYDNAGKATGRRYPDGSRATFAYDAVGSRTLMANAGGRYTTTYDELGRRKSVSTPMSKRLTYTYDANSRRTQLQAADVGVFTYAYDSNSRLSYVRNPQNDRTTFTYDDNSRRTLKKLSNGSRTTYTYDAAGHLIRLANVKSTSVTISSFDYHYDKAGNRTMILDADGARTTYSYDNTYQLTVEHRSGSNSYINTYVYDKAGNRTLKNESGTRTTTIYDNANQIVYALDASGRTTYSYDADGNQTLILTPAGARTTTTWDYDNHTTLIRLPSGVRNTMTYDPEGLRAKLEESAGTTKFVYDGQAYLLETDNSNVLTAAYTQEPTKYGSLISQRRGSTTSWYTFDAPSSTRQLLDGSQNVTDSYLYDAYGNILTSSGSTVNRFQWHGSYGCLRDADTGLYYLRARIINPKIAIFTTTDPLRFVNGMNVYKLYFVPGGNDPSGMAAPAVLYGVLFLFPFVLKGCQPDWNPRTDIQCCNDAKTNRLDINPWSGNADMAGVICCDGRRVPCLWISNGAAQWTPSGPLVDPTAISIAEECILAHETQHIGHSSQKSCQMGNLYRDELKEHKGLHKTWNGKANVDAMVDDTLYWWECDAYNTQLICLTKAIQAGKCKGNTQCESDLEREKTAVSDRAEIFCRQAVPGS